MASVCDKGKAICSLSHREIELTPPKLWGTRDRQLQETLGVSL